MCTTPESNNYKGMLRPNYLPQSTVNMDRNFHSSVPQVLGSSMPQHNSRLPIYLDSRRKEDKEKFVPCGTPPPSQLPTSPYDEYTIPEEELDLRKTTDNLNVLVRAGFEKAFPDRTSFHFISAQREQELCDSDNEDPSPYYVYP